ncbi:MAG TPA: ATP-binding protein [Candidatus Aminicenantes bacterium]|nr:ATP-binding protein [Candidatus Aminicenantes bacterium]
MIRDVSLRTLLIAAFLLVALVPMAVAVLIGTATAHRELKAQVFRQLESLRDLKREQIAAYFKERRADIAVLAQTPFVLQAAADLKKAYLDCGAPNAAVLRGGEGGALIAPESYRRVHDRYLAYFREVIERYGYYDLFLMGPEAGDTWFTVRKEPDFAVRIGELDTPLRRVWRRAARAGEVALSDTEPYAPSHGDPAQFIAAPLRDGGRMVGVLALQVPIQAIDRIMRERAGMGESSETYLAGRDRRMRSDSWLDPGHRTVVASFRGDLTGHGADLPQVRRALSGETGREIGWNYLGRPVLVAFAPVDLLGVRWAIAAEITEAEVERQILSSLTPRIAVLMAVFLAVAVLLAFLLSGLVGNNLRAMSAELQTVMARTEAGETGQRADVDVVGVDFRPVVTQTNRLLDAFVRQAETRRQLEQHAVYAQKVEAIGRLAGSIAHDFKTILSTLQAQLFMLGPNFTADDTPDRSLAAMRLAIDRGGELVGRILSFSHPDGGREERIALALRLEQTLALFATSLPPGVELKSDLRPEAGMVRLDPVQLDQILLNLLSNAVWALRERGGRLTVGCGAGPVNSGKVWLTVADTGCGMDPETRRRLFEPFFSRKARGEGTGLGLSVVGGIVSRMGGEIRVTSAPGRGSRFTVILPASELH